MKLAVQLNKQNILAESFFIIREQFVVLGQLIMAEEGKTVSFANIHGQDWEVKEISVYGAAKAFIRQLSVGMDLTHVSIPAIFLLPYSILEFIAVRMTHAFHLLLQIPKEPDPRKRLEGKLNTTRHTNCLANLEEKKSSIITTRT